MASARKTLEGQPGTPPAGRKADAKKAFAKYLEIQPTSKSAPYAQDMIKSLQ